MAEAMRALLEECREGHECPFACPELMPIQRHTLTAIGWTAALSKLRVCLNFIARLLHVGLPSLDDLPEPVASVLVGLAGCDAEHPIRLSQALACVLIPQRPKCLIVVKRVRVVQQFPDLHRMLTARSQPHGITAARMQALLSSYIHQLTHVRQVAGQSP